MDSYPPGLSSREVDSLREIAANKVCALLGRAEIRDLVDLRAILQKGFDLASVLRDAERKDGGVSPATLAWVLDSLCIGDDAEVRRVHEAAVRQWQRLSARFTTLLAGHEPVVSRVRTPIGRRGIFAVRIGADSRAEADAVCRRLRGAGGSCIVLRNR